MTDELKNNLNRCIRGIENGIKHCVVSSFGLRFAFVAVLILPWLSGCRSMNQRPGMLPDRDRFERDQLVFFSNFKVPRKHRVLNELALKRQIITQKLAIPQSDEPINVYLFEDENRFRKFIRKNYPRIPLRRAFFLKNDTSLNVFAHWNDNVSRDLSHEVTHGYLHSVIPNLPLWLDEGLAEYFEVTRGRHGINRPHVLELSQSFRRGDWKPDLSRLESLNDPGQMSQLDYAESWLWVHFLLESEDGSPKLLRDQLARLRMKGESDSLSSFLSKRAEDPTAQVTRHLKRLAEELEPDAVSDSAKHQ